MHSISDRLIAGRKALGLSQQALADRVGIALRSQQNYEKGDRSPDANYLAAVAAAGVDVLYLLTGVHTSTHVALSRVRAASEAAGFVKGSEADQAMAAEVIFNQLNSQLPADEQMWLDSYREWSPEVKKRELRRAMGLPPTDLGQSEPAPELVEVSQPTATPEKKPRARVLITTMNGNQIDVSAPGTILEGNTYHQGSAQLDSKEKRGKP